MGRIFVTYTAEKFLKGKGALITGGTSAFGRGAVCVLAEKGDFVVSGELMI